MGWIDEEPPHITGNFIDDSSIAYRERLSCLVREAMALTATGCRAIPGQAVATGKTGLCRYRNENVLTFCPRKDFCSFVHAHLYIISACTNERESANKNHPNNKKNSTRCITDNFFMIHVFYPKAHPASPESTSCLACSEQKAEEVPLDGGRMCFQTTGEVPSDEA